MPDQSYLDLAASLRRRAPAFVADGRAEDAYFAEQNARYAEQLARSGEAQAPSAQQELFDADR